MTGPATPAGPAATIPGDEYNAVPEPAALAAVGDSPADTPAADPRDVVEDDDYDAGPWEDADVGLQWDLGGGRSLYIGEISRDTHEDWGGDEALGRNDCWYAVGYDGDACVGVLARVVDREAADQLGALLVGAPRTHRPRARRIRAGATRWVPGTPPGERVYAAEADAVDSAGEAAFAHHRVREALEALIHSARALSITAELADDLARKARPDGRALRPATEGDTA